MKRALGLIAVAILAACSSSSNGSADIATGALRDALAGRLSAFYDRLAPEIQSRTTREAFVTCMAKQSTGSSNNVTVTAAETVKGAALTKADGSTVNADTVAVRLATSQESLTVVVWIVDGRVAKIDAPAANTVSCLTRL